MTAGTGAQERMLAELERLKVRAGMSFAQLQSAVPYSRSALHRYFTGQSPIPRDALVAVVRACGGDEAAMVRMWEAAQADPALGAEAPFTPVGPVGPVGPARPIAAAVETDNRIRTTAPYIQSPARESTGEYRSAWAELRNSAAASEATGPTLEAQEHTGEHRSTWVLRGPALESRESTSEHCDSAASSPEQAPTRMLTEQPAAPTPAADATDPTPSAASADPAGPSPTRQRAVRAWFVLAFVIVAIMAIRPLIDSAPQSSAAAPVAPTTDQPEAADPASSSVPAPSTPAASVPSPSSTAPTSHGTSRTPAVPSRDASVPPEVTIVSDQDNGRILTLRSGSIVEVALTGQWAKIRVTTDGSLVHTAPPVAAPWARQVEAFVVGTSGVSTSFCAYPISHGFDAIPGSVCVPLPGKSRPFNVTIVRA